MDIKDQIKALLSHHQDGVQMCQRILRQLGDDKPQTKEQRIREKVRIQLLKKTGK